MTKNKTQESQAFRINFIENHPDMKEREMMEIMNMSKSYVTKICNKANIQKRKNETWTHEQIEFMKNHISETDEWIKENMPEPKRTIHAIRSRKIILGYRKQHTLVSRQPWTYEEDKFLKNNTDKPIKWLMGNKPGPERTKAAIKLRMAKTRQEQNHQKHTWEHPDNIAWSAEQMKFLEEHKNENDEWIMENLPGPKRTIGAIKNKKCQLRIIKDSTNKWTNEQDKFIKKHSRLKTDEWIAKNIPGPERTKNAIRKRRAKLGICKNNSPQQ